MGILSENEDKRLAKEICSAAVEQGWTYEHGGKHYLVRSPNGHKHPIPTTPSDHRSLLNTIAQLRRDGFIWPWNKKDHRLKAFKTAKFEQPTFVDDPASRLAEYSEKIRIAQKQLDTLNDKLRNLKKLKETYETQIKDAILGLHSTNELERRDGEKRHKELNKIREQFSEIPELEQQVATLASKIESWIKVVAEVQPKPVPTSRQRRINTLVAKVSKDELKELLDRKEGLAATREEAAAYLSQQHPELGAVTVMDISGLIKHYGLIIPSGRIPSKKY